MAQVQNAILDPLAGFWAALARIGFSVPAHGVLNHNGFNGIYNLMIFSKDQIKRICTVIREDPVTPISISMEQQQLLTAIRHWVKTKVRTNRDINPELFTCKIAIAEAIKMVNVAEEVISEKLRGQGCIHLNNIIRTIDNPLPGTQYETEQELLIATAPLAGDDLT
jgi:hypothetical protein